ncbi:hypothetical protein P171DRAFT_21294 [Karstenula rhodostoma CBS 690.94]|uniref:Uncharacterized protein n=1 Tax=Karstenula rhodostoma CBS 690.94 TaxID=1392251 RepID=A0A9P4PXC0_9PLEO|nr:hypothetical protein P171DRAFT_21294 [Karstenula rhodostoma CBS 690.94]
MRSPPHCMEAFSYSSPSDPSPVHIRAECYADSVYLTCRQTAYFQPFIITWRHWLCLRLHFYKITRTRYCNCRHLTTIPMVAMRRVKYARHHRTSMNQSLDYPRDHFGHVSRSSLLSLNPNRIGMTTRLNCVFALGSKQQEKLSKMYLNQKHFN